MSSTPEAMFWENAGYNARMAKSKTKSSQRGYFRLMKPGQVLKELVERSDIVITERTLRRYVEDGLAPAPDRKSGGRGKGTIVDYPNDAPVQIAACWTVLKRNAKLTKKDVGIIRELGIAILNSANKNNAELLKVELAPIMNKFKKKPKLAISILTRRWLLRYLSHKYGLEGVSYEDLYPRPLDEKEALEVGAFYVPEKTIIYVKKENIEIHLPPDD